jgi:hypothetical protein
LGVEVGGVGSIGTPNGDEPLGKGIDAHIDLYRLGEDSLFWGIKGPGLSLDYQLQSADSGHYHRFGVSYHRFVWAGAADVSVGPTLLWNPSDQPEIDPYGLAVTGSFKIRFWQKLGEKTTQFTPYIGIQLGLGGQWGEGGADFLGEAALTAGVQVWFPPFRSDR